MDKQVEKIYEEALASMTDVGVDWQKILEQFQAISTPENVVDVLTCIQALENEMVLRDQVDKKTFDAILEVIDPADLRLVRQTFFASYKEMGDKLDHLIVYPFGSLEEMIKKEFLELKILADVPMMVRPYIDYGAVAAQWRSSGQYIEGHKVYEYID